MNKKNIIKRVNKAKVALRNKIRAGLRKVCDFALADEPIVEDISEDQDTETEDLTEGCISDVEGSRIALDTSKAVKYTLFAIAAVWALKRQYKRGYKDAYVSISHIFNDIYNGHHVRFRSSIGQCMVVARVK